MMKKFFSILNLAYFFVLHIFRRLFGKSEGLLAFEKNYPASRFVSLENKEMFQKLGMCTACGDCNQVCPALKTKDKTFFMGPMALPLTYARSLYFIDAVEIPWDICKDCNECEKVCPEKIPLKQTLNWLVHA